MIPYIVFKRCLKDIKKFSDSQQVLGERLNLLGDIDITYGDDLVESYVNFLGDIFGTTLIDEWVYEHDFGRRSGVTMKELYKKVR